MNETNSATFSQTIGSEISSTIGTTEDEPNVLIPEIASDILNHDLFDGDTSFLTDLSGEESISTEDFSLLNEFLGTNEDSFSEKTSLINNVNNVSQNIINQGTSSSFSYSSQTPLPTSVLAALGQQNNSNN